MFKSGTVPDGAVSLWWWMVGRKMPCFVSINMSGNTTPFGVVFLCANIIVMSHVDLLHGAAVAKINEIRQTQEVPPAMQAVYDYLHQKQIDKAAKIKAKQAEYTK